MGQPHTNGNFKIYSSIQGSRPGLVNILISFAKSASNIHFLNLLFDICHYDIYFIFNEHANNLPYVLTYISFAIIDKHLVYLV